jgi:hypothetical protein
VLNQLTSGLNRISSPRRATIALVLASAGIVRAASPQPTTYLLDASSRNADDVRAAADRALSAKIVTIVDKPQASPTGDPHDYVSYARYYWPDPSKPDGLPYLSKDGYHNEKQVALGDEPRLFTMEGNIKALAFGWAVLHREDCARRAGDWLRACILAPATAMKPNLEYAQIRLGHDHNHGSSSGVLDGRGLAEITDAIALLQGSPAFTAAEEKSLRAWFAGYLEWLLSAKNAQAEHHAANNHGSWFLAQAIPIARFCGRDDIARQLCEEDKGRIAHQILRDGSQPEELRRKDGLGYSVFNLQAQLIVARLAKDLGIDLWHYQSADGGSLPKAIAYLEPYNREPAKWPGAQLKKLSPGFLDGVLAQAAALDKPSR